MKIEYTIIHILFLHSLVICNSREIVTQMLQGFEFNSFEVDVDRFD